METGHKNRKQHRFNDGIEEKECFRCKLWKSLDKFNKNPKVWDNLDRRCRDCVKAYREEHKQTINTRQKKYKETHKAERKVWLEKNKEKQAAYNKEYQAKYRKENAERLKEQQATYFQTNKQKINERIRKRRAENIQLRLANNLRARIPVALKGIAKSAHTIDLIGCSVDALRDHLSAKFDDKMSWDNYGEWHVDHIIPCAAFNLSDPIEQRICFHYTNLQPMWAKDNIAKSDNITVDVAEYKNRLTPEIIERLNQLRTQEKEKEDAKKKALINELDDSFGKFWQLVEEPKRIRIRYSEPRPIEEVKLDISQKVHKFYQTPEGKANKTAALAKRSETMRVAREAYRQGVVSKICRLCNVNKPAADYCKKAAAKDGLQAYCKSCTLIRKKR